MMVCSRSQLFARAQAALLSLLVGAATLVQAQVHPRDAPVDLVLQITVDMLKGEMPFQQYPHLDGGIRYLLDNGVAYRNAHFQHSTTFTAVGHAVIATGAAAAQHGLAGNDWADRSSGDRIYCVADPGARPLIDVASLGTSPRNLTASTFGDEIVLSSGEKSRMFSVSVKDRGAIIPGGRLGKAFWYDSGSGRFLSSDWYYDALPEWVTRFNDSARRDRYRGKAWSLQDPPETYIFSHQDAREAERGYADLGTGFPHSYDNPSDTRYYGGLRFSPAGDELTLDFVRALIDNQAVGQRGQTDVLAVSFSALDYVGHAFGTFSLEYEDQVRQVDRIIGELLDFIDERIGLNRTLVVLTSDHGADDIPEYQSARGLDAGRHDPAGFIRRANAALKTRFGIDDDLIMAFWNPSLYLQPDKMEKHELDYPEVEHALAAIFREENGFAYAVTRTDLESGNLPDTPLMQKLQRAFHPQRSGNVLVIQNPFWYLYPDAEEFAAMHGSPYAYDTHVPIIAAGPGIPRGLIVDRPVAVSSIAPTLTTYVGARLPSGADHPPLIELVSGQPRDSDIQ
ncbi:alkaline phosphatase family protein [Haliea sp. E1-2-M8]|uniref:alkaline phosphatase family protein n=1 Tax=Haliea sp. E1-2-M8 TaxID=3064706 RepID=UPI0027211C8D|nr:alkaline phosphatase family protein [Haliea sp. E1-2-M8]MDO8863138.1 alkaline phosphatase family protein [Haliea sp. E1-2-M8]